MQDFRAIDGRDPEPDDSRPRNVWPRLILFGVVVLAMLAMFGACFAAFINVPDRELRVDTDTIEPSIPRFLPVTTLGADEANLTYGAWVAPQPNGMAVALLSRGPESGCQVEWAAALDFAGETGVFVDECSGARYDSSGAVLGDTAPRDLHRFPSERDGNEIVVSMEEVILGQCREEGASGCSMPGDPERRDVPSGALPEDFGDN